MIPEDVVRRFVTAINEGDLESIVANMSEDHCFVDSGGARIEGREAMRQAWLEYFEMVPGYRIDIEEVIVQKDRVVVFGKAGGSYRAERPQAFPPHWETPAVWRARVEGERIREWRVYADNEPLRRLMRGGGQEPA